ncbi:MAG: hypothetical protein AAGC55_10010 [Myxococcota bacterium]
MNGENTARSGAAVMDLPPHASLGLGAFLVGTILVVIGDAIYGLGYYEKKAVIPSLYMVSAVFGVVAGGLYIAGGRTLGRLTSGSWSPALVSGGITVFGYMLAVVHAFAGAIMLAQNYVLRSPQLGELALLVGDLDTAYAVLATPMFVALIVGYVCFGYATVRGRTVFPRWSVVVNALVLCIPQQAFAEALWFPLRAPALMGGIHLCILLILLRRARTNQRAPGA